MSLGSVLDFVHEFQNLRIQMLRARLARGEPLTSHIIYVLDRVLVVPHPVDPATVGKQRHRKLVLQHLLGLVHS